MRYQWNEPCVLEVLKKTFACNKVAITSTDTVLGFLAPVTKEGFENLNHIKGRTNKPYIVLVGSLEQVPHLCTLPTNPRVLELMRQCWPGPLTLLLPINPTIDSFMQSSGVIALRIPNHPGLLAFLNQEKAAFSTSANLAGQPVPASIDELDPCLADAIDIVVLDPDHHAQVASTIIDCTTDIIKLSRQGCYPISRIEKICGKIVY